MAVLVCPFMRTSLGRMFRKLTSVMMFAVACLPATSQTKTISLTDAADRAIELSQIRVPGANPFHLKATLVESTNPDSVYTAEIEEYWASPQKWRRRISSEKFSQTIIQTTGQTIEQNTGDYYPLWLRNMVAALVDPIPMFDELKQINAHLGDENAQSERCVDLQTRVGEWPAQNSAYQVFCFDAHRGLLSSIVTPSYSAFFVDYARFSNKLVARKITYDPEPGTTLQLRIAELSPLAELDEKLFSADQIHPTAPLRSMKIDQAVANGLALNTPPIQWPSVRSGRTSGVVSIYVSADTSGRVREAWPLNSDNAGLGDTVRDQVKTWQFKPVAVQGAPVQLETVLTFAFDTKVANPIPLLTNEEARALATNIVEPECLPPGTSVTLKVSVDENGEILGIGNPNGVDNDLFGPAYAALDQWRFRPYVRNGKPDRFDANITLPSKSSRPVT